MDRKSRTAKGSLIPLDASNPVVQLCLQGMQAEAEGNHDEARRLFSRAWQASTDDFEACIAAHYLARQQNEPKEALRWNQEALNRAQIVGDERVMVFYPSLYLNLGFSYEMIGNQAEAREYYLLADSSAELLPEDSYSQVVRRGIAEGLKRVKSPSE